MGLTRELSTPEREESNINNADTGKRKRRRGLRSIKRRLLSAGESHYKSSFIKDSTPRYKNMTLKNVIHTGRSVNPNILVTSFQPSGGGRSGLPWKMAHEEGTANFERRKGPRGPRSKGAT